MNKHLLMVAITAGCASTSGAVLAGIGEDTARALTRQYHDTREACAGNSPAFKCSGILLRTTKPSLAYHTWDHSPNSREKGGVSFSYMRADAPIQRLAGSGKSGYILMPDSLKKPEALAYEVLCAYPTDGDSWYRDRGGCGDNSRTSDTEMFCQEIGVRTAGEWFEKYTFTPGHSGERYYSQCAFDMSESRGAEATKEFYGTLRLMKLLRGDPFPWNEVMVKAWDENHAHRLPIQAFFYVKNKHGSGDYARHDQQDFYAQTGRFIPIIEIDLHNRKGPTFIYKPSVQSMKEPG
ncbi:hypothetical protein ACIQAL_24225 [Pseudomonas sp. NPDC088368]|uniref:hypothetical protein n=1 Tax=Pseudomonas sp. NPDC088368 TaxID=3364453 RepID=UPI0038080AE8